MIAENVKGTLTVHRKPIPQGHGKFLIISVLKEWAERDNHINCKGSFLTWPMAKAISTTHNIDMVNYDFNQQIEGHENDEIVCDNDKTRNGNRQTRKTTSIYFVC